MHKTGPRRQHTAAIRIQLHGGPGTPVPARPVQVSAARLEAKRPAVGIALEHQTAPERKQVGVEDLALDRSLLLDLRTEAVDLPDIPRRGVNPALTSGVQAGDLGRRGRDQHRIQHVGIETIHGALVPGSDQRTALAVEGDGIDDVASVTPNLARVPVGLDPIDFRAARNRSGQGSHARGRRRGRRLRLTGNTDCHGACCCRSGRREWRRRDGRRRGGLLVAHAGGVDRAVLSHRNRRDLALGRLVQNKALRGRRDPQDQPPRFRADDQVALTVDGQRAGMCLLGLKEHDCPCRRE